MTATLLVGDVFERQTQLIADGAKFDLIITSPPFLALRSYLPDDHPDKHKEIGSEATPADYLDVLLQLTAEWRQLLAPHGSIAIELGDTYAGSGGAGGDYLPGGLREGEPKAEGSAKYARVHPDPPPGVDPRVWRPLAVSRAGRNLGGGAGWPLDKSLCGIPTLYTWSLAYGRNLLTGAPSPAGQWRIRNLKPWIRTNPPVGALGDKERPATSYITVATLAHDRWFDLDAVRNHSDYDRPNLRGKGARAADAQVPGQHLNASDHTTNPAGAPPLDWWHQVDAIIDHELQARAGKPASNTRTRTPGHPKGGKYEGRLGECTLEAENSTVGARGWHIRRALEKAGILPPHPDALDISPKGYSGAHYAVWPPELVRQLVDEMCPRRVCTQCGEPSRRITVDKSTFSRQPELAAHIKERREALGITLDEVNNWFGYVAGANWWETSTKAARIPNPQDWLILCERLGLDRDRFDDFVTGNRRWTQSTVKYANEFDHNSGITQDHTGRVYHRYTATKTRLPVTGWSDCGHDTWRPGRILDPFVGSGTTLAVATGMGRDAVGIDLDPRNAHLTEARCGMFLIVDWGHLEPTDELPPQEIVSAALNSTEGP